MGDPLHDRALITRGYPWDRSQVGPKSVLVAAIDGKNTKTLTRYITLVVNSLANQFSPFMTHTQSAFQQFADDFSNHHEFLFLTVHIFL
jgi:hypothetical protein